MLKNSIDEYYCTIKLNNLVMKWLNFNWLAKHSGQWCGFIILNQTIVENRYTEWEKNGYKLENIESIGY